MEYYLRNSILLFTFLLTICCGCYNYKLLDKPGRILLLFVTVSLVIETIAYIFAKLYGNNLLVYNVGKPIEVFIIMLYFNYSIDKFRKWHIGILIGIISLLLGGLNSFLIQKDSVISYFLTYEAVLILIMSMICLVHILYKTDVRNIRKMPAFYTSVGFIIYWSTTYMLWTLLDYYVVNFNHTPCGILYSVSIMNYFLNMMIALLFYRYPKLINHVP